MSQWISVEDRIPDEMGDYVAWLETPIKHGKRLVIYSFFKGEWLAINGAAWPGMPKPSHWMDPEPPEDV